MPDGNECFYKYILEYVEDLSEACLKSCHGLYGDVRHQAQGATVTISKSGEPVDNLFKEYLNYKRGFQPNYLDYFTNLTQTKGSPLRENLTTAMALAGCTHYKLGDCKRIVDVGAASCGGSYKCKYELLEKLQVVQIYFDSPTFDKITRDAKTNDIAKLSLIGGTLGLLTGEWKQTFY